MGSAGRPARPMQELFQETSSQKMQKHLDMIQSLLDKGYEIESQEEFDDRGADNEEISYRLVTVLKPKSDFSLPLLKLEAAERFGDYFDDKEEFYEFEEARFEMKAYKKAADVKAFRDPWQPFEMG